METENLTKACHSARFLLDEIQAAHRDAIKSGNAFAEVAIFDLIEAAALLEQRVTRLLNVAESGS